MPKDIKLAETILGRLGKKRKPYRSSNMFKLSSKTTTKEGKRQYMKLYMRQRRQEDGKRKQ